MSPAATISAANDSAADADDADRHDREGEAGDRERRERRSASAMPPRDAAHRAADPPLHWTGGAVAGAPDRRDVARHRRVVAELLAQALDVDVDGPVEDVGLADAVDRVEELVAGQDPAVGLEQGRQEAELQEAEGDVARRRRAPRGGPRRPRGRRAEQLGRERRGRVARCAAGSSGPGRRAPPARRASAGSRRRPRERPWIRSPVEPRAESTRIGMSPSSPASGGSRRGRRPPGSIRSRTTSRGALLLDRPQGGAAVAPP